MIEPSYTYLQHGEHLRLGAPADRLAEDALRRHRHARLLAQQRLGKVRLQLVHMCLCSEVVVHVYVLAHVRVRMRVQRVIDPLR